MLDERNILWVFYVFLLVVVFVIVSAYVQEAASDTLHKQKVLASNLAFLHDTVVSKEEAYVEYKINEDFLIEFNSKEGCFVYVKEKDSEAGSSFECGKSVYYDSVLNFENPKILAFNKSGNSFKISAK